MKFHNGNDFDADSVVFSLEDIRKSDQAGAVDPVDKIVPVDKYTVDVYTKTPWYLLLGRMATGNLVPEDRAWTTSSDFTPGKAVGTGPYKLVEWQKGQRIVMERNDTWWGGKPPYARVVWRPLPEVATRTSALLAGEVDLITDVQPQDVARINGKDGLAVKTVTSDGVSYLRMRLDGIYADPRFRQALNYAIDKDAIRKGVMGGFGVTTHGNRDPNMLGVDPNLGEYPYDLDKAKQLIAESGYQGQPVVIETGQGFTFKDAELAQGVGGYFQKAGLNVDVRVLEGGAYNAKKSNVDVEGILNTSSGNNIHDFENVLDDLMVRGGTDIQQWKHPRAIELRKQLEQTLDPQERIKLSQEGAQLLKDDAPIVIIASFVNAYGMKKSTNWEPRPDQSIWIREFKAG